MANVSPTDKDYELWVLLHQTRDAIYKARERELGPIGVSPMMTEALFAIQAINGPAIPAEISRWLFREPHSVTGLLQRMEKEGLVNKTRDLERRNLVRVSLTERGQQTLDASLKRESIHRILSSLSEEQRQQLKSCLETLLPTALAELGMAKPPFPPTNGDGNSDSQ